MIKRQKQQQTNKHKGSVESRTLEALLSCGLRDNFARQGFFVEIREHKNNYLKYIKFKCCILP